MYSFAHENKACNMSVMRKRNTIFLLKVYQFVQSFERMSEKQRSTEEVGTSVLMSRIFSE